MTTPKDDGGPIAPTMITRQRIAPDTISESRMDVEGGLTIRDWFAGMALQGMNAMPSWDKGTTKEIAREAYSIADAMLAARKEDA
jgi:hypothetical protein